jgi:hypothetical protein
MSCADYTGACHAPGDVLCTVCGQRFCWEHILTLRFADQPAILHERAVCRGCTERLFDDLQEERLQSRRDSAALAHDVAALETHLEEGSEPPPG